MQKRIYSQPSENEKVLRVGLCESKKTGSVRVFRQVWKKLDKKFRVWMVSGIDSSCTIMDASEFYKMHKVTEYHSVIANVMLGATSRRQTNES
mgnify:CR=1 FL=1